MRLILIGRQHIACIDAEFFCNARREFFRLLDLRGARPFHRRDQVRIAPNRHAVLAPVEPESPARQAFTGIPLALSVVQKATRSEAGAQTADEIIGNATFGRADCGCIPLGGLQIVHGNECRLAAHGQPHIVGCEVGINLLAQHVETPP